MPHATSLETTAELEEERRLFYVALTRARERVHLLQASYRRSWNASGGGMSRFLSEIPADCVVVEQRDLWPATRRRAPGRSAAAATAGTSRGGPSPIGVRVIHPQFGEGVVVASEGMGERAKLTVQFRRGGTKKILAAFAELSHAD